VGVYNTSAPYQRPRGDRFQSVKERKLGAKGIGACWGLGRSCTAQLHACHGWQQRAPGVVSADCERVTCGPRWLQYHAIRSNKSSPAPGDVSPVLVHWEWDLEVKELIHRESLGARRRNEYTEGINQQQQLGDGLD
jgi:hypothetical protein